MGKSADYRLDALEARMARLETELGIEPQLALPFPKEAEPEPDHKGASAWDHRGFKAYLIENDLTPKDLAPALNVATSTISNWGSRAGYSPSFLNYTALLDHLELPYGTFMKRDLHKKGTQNGH